MQISYQERGDIQVRPYGRTFHAETTIAGKKIDLVVKEVRSSNRHFLTEIKQKLERLEALKHAGLPRIREYARSDEEVVIIWDEVPGRSFKDYGRGTGSPWNEIRPLAVAALKILKYLHKHKVYHLGIKPSNVRVDNGEVRLVDIGYDQRPSSDPPNADDPYLAPEQRDERIADQRSDIYAFGATLYTVLTGEKPPPPPDQQRVTARLNQQEHVPAHVRHAIAKAMCEQPAARFRSVDEFLSALQHPAYVLPVVVAIAIVVIVIAGIVVALKFPSVSQGGTGPTDTPPTAPSTRVAATGSPSPSTAPPGPTAPPTTIEATATALPSSTVEVIRCANEAQTGELVRIHAAFALTSSDEAIANAAKDRRAAAEHAFQQKCAELTNLRIELVIWDDQGLAPVAGDIADQIVSPETWPNSLCMIGHSNSATSKFTKERYNGQNITMIPPSASASTLNSDVNNMVRLIGLDVGQGRAGAILANELGYGSALIIEDESAPNAVEAAQSFRDEFLGGKSTFTYTNTLESDNENPVSLPRNSPPDVVYYTGEVGDLEVLLITLTDQGFKNIPIIAIDRLDKPNELQEILDNKDWDGIITVTTMSLPADTAAGQRLLGSEIEFETEDTYASYSAETHDAVTLCLQGIVNTSRPNIVPSALSVRDAIFRIDIESTNGEYFVPPYRFDSTTGNLLQQLYFVRVTENRKLKTKPTAISCELNPQGGCNSSYGIDLQ